MKTLLALMILIVLISCGTAGKAVRVRGTCDCHGTGDVLLEAGDTARLQGGE